MPDIVLAVDTAFDRCSVGLYDVHSRSLVARREPSIGKGHAERLMGLVEEAQEEAGIRYADLARIGVTTGPGSFTGLRVGVSAARGWVLALGIPAVGISTLEAMAASLDVPRAANADVLAVLDAKRGEIYAALFDCAGRTISAPAALAPSDLAHFVGDREEPLHLAGTGADIAAEILGPRVATVVTREAYVDVAALARLASEREVGSAPSPLYLRGPDAKRPSSASRLAFRAENTPQPCAN